MNILTLKPTFYHDTTEIQHSKFQRPNYVQFIIFPPRTVIYTCTCLIYRYKAILSLSYFVTLYLVCGRMQTKCPDGRCVSAGKTCNYLHNKRLIQPINEIIYQSSYFLSCLLVCGHIEIECPDGRCVSAGGTCDCPSSFEKFCDGECVDKWDRCPSDPCPDGKQPVREQCVFMLNTKKTIIDSSIV